MVAGASLALTFTGPAGAQVLDKYFPPFPFAPGGSGLLGQTSAPDQVPFSGLRTGDFIIRPTITSGSGYDSNVDGVANGHGSAAVLTSGSVAATSDWARNALSGLLSFNNSHYLDRPLENLTNWTASVGGVYDIGYSHLNASYAHLSLTETPRDLASVLITQPVQFTVDHVTLSYATSPLGRISLTPQFDFDRYSFGSTTLPGQAFNEDYRDRMVYQGGATARYQLAQQRDIILALRATQIDYAREVIGAPSRDSDGFTVLAGIDYGGEGLIRLRAAAGYQERLYRSSEFKNISAPIFNASLSWSPTRRTIITATLHREIAEAETEVIASYIYTGIRLDANQEVRSDVQLHGYVELRKADFGSTATLPVVVPFPEASGSQTIWTAGLSATWTLNRYTRLRASYDYTNRQAAAPAQFSENVALLSLMFGF